MAASVLSVDTRLIRVSEVARHLSLSRSTIYQMMDRGELPYVKLRKSRRVPFEAVEQLISKNLVAASESTARTASP